MTQQSDRVQQAIHRIALLAEQFQAAVQQTEHAQALDILQVSLQAIASSDIGGLASLTTHVDPIISSLALDISANIQRSQSSLSSTTSPSNLPSNPPSPSPQKSHVEVEVKKQVKEVKEMKEVKSKKDEGMLKNVFALFGKKEPEATVMIFPQKEPKVYYDDKLKKYIIEGEEPEPEKVIPPPPPSAARKVSTKKQIEIKESQIHSMMAPPAFKRRSVEKSKKIISANLPSPPQLTLEQFLEAIAREIEDLMANASPINYEQQDKEQAALKNVCSLQGVNIEIAMLKQAMSDSLQIAQTNLSLQQMVSLTQQLCTSGSLCEQWISEGFRLRSNLSTARETIHNLETEKESALKELSESKEAWEQLKSQEDESSSAARKEWEVKCQKAQAEARRAWQEAKRHETQKKQLREELGKQSTDSELVRQSFLIALEAKATSEQTQRLLAEALRAEQELLGKILERRLEIANGADLYFIERNDSKWEQESQKWLQASEIVNSVVNQHLLSVNEWQEKLEKSKAKERGLEEQFERLKNAVGQQNAGQKRNIARLKLRADGYKQAKEESEERATKAEVQCEKLRKKLSHSKKAYEDLSREVLERLANGSHQETLNITREEKAKAEAQLDILRSELSTKEQALKQCEQEMTDFLLDYEKGQTAVQQAQKVIYALKSQLEEQKEEAEEQFQTIRLKASVQKEEAAVRIVALQERLSIARTELERTVLREEQAKEDSKQVIATLQRKIAQGKREGEARSEQLQMVERERKCSEERERRISQELRVLRAVMEAKEIECVGHRLKIQRNYEQLSQLVEGQAELKKEMNAAQIEHQQEMESLLSQGAESEISIRQLMISIEQYRKQESRLRQETESKINSLISEIVSANEQSNILLLQADGFAQLVTSLDAAMQTQKEVLQEARRRAAFLEDNLKSLSAEKEEASELALASLEQIQTQSQQLNQAQKQIQRLNQQLLQIRSTFKQDIEDTVNRRLTEASSRFNEQRENQKTEVTHLRHSLRQALEQLEALRSRRNERTIDADKVRMESELNEVKTALREMLQEQEASEKIFEGLSKQLEEEKQKNEEMSSNNAQLKAREARLTEQSNQLRKELSGYKRDNQSMAQILSEKNVQRPSLSEEDRQELQSQIGTLQKTNAALLKEGKTLGAKLSNFTDERKALEQQIKEMREIVESQQTELISLQKELSAVQTELKRSEDTLLETQGSLLEANLLFNDKERQAELKIESLERELSGTQTLKNSLRRAEESLQALEAQNASLLQEKVHLMRQNDELMEQKMKGSPQASQEKPKVKETSLNKLPASKIVRPNKQEKGFFGSLSSLFLTPTEAETLQRASG